VRTKSRTLTKSLFGEVLREIRKEKGLSQDDLSKTSGIDRTFISQIERGDSNPSIEYLLKISRSLDVKASDLILRLENKILASQK